MKDKFTRYYLILTIIYAILGLLQILGYYLDNIILKIIMILLSSFDLALLILSIVYLSRITKKKLNPKYKILPISYIVYFALFSIIGILEIIITGNPSYALETGSMFNQLIWILGGCYNIFQIGYSYYLLKLR